MFLFRLKSNCSNRGDMEAHKAAHLPNRHYLKCLVCDFCLARSNVDALSYGNVRLDALWRTTLDSRDPSADQRSPWCRVRGFAKHRRLFDGDLSRIVF